MPSTKTYRVSLEESSKELTRLIALLGSEADALAHVKFLSYEDDQRRLVGRHEISVVSFCTEEEPDAISDQIEIYKGTRLIDAETLELWGYLHDTVFECDESVVEFKYDEKLGVWVHRGEASLVLWFRSLSP